MALLLTVLAGCGGGAAADAGVAGDAEGVDGPRVTLVVPDAGFSDAARSVDGDSEAGLAPFRGCADPLARDRYRACQSAQAEQACLRNGGIWEWLGCFDCGGSCTCIPPDDSECICTQASDCFDYCLWRPSDPASPGLALDVAACSSAGEGRCDVPYDVRGWVVLDKPGTCVGGPARDR